MKKRVLIVEDNQILAENFARILRRDFEISIVDNAGDAILEIDKSSPNVILLDILLSGHSAFSLLNELQSYPDTSGIPIVICSDLAESLRDFPYKKYNVLKIIDKSLANPKEILEACLYAAN